MHVIVVEIEFLSHVVVRQGEPHARQAQDPDPKRLMMTGKAGAGSIIEASVTGLAQVALTLGLGLVTTLCGDRRTVTQWTMDTVGPPQAADGFNTFGVVNEGWHVYHGTSIAHQARWHKGP